MTAFTKNNVRKTAISINEVSLLRQSKQTSYLKILSNKKPLFVEVLTDPHQKVFDAFKDY